MTFLAPSFFAVSRSVIAASYFALLLGHEKFNLKDNTGTLSIRSIMTKPTPPVTLVEDPSN